MSNVTRVSCRYTRSKLLKNTYSPVSDDTTYGKFKLWLQAISVTNGKSNQDRDDFLTTPDYLSEYGEWKRDSGQQNFPLRLDIAGGYPSGAFAL